MDEFEKLLIKNFEILIKKAQKNQGILSSIDIDVLCENDDDDRMYNKLVEKLKANDITVKEEGEDEEAPSIEELAKEETIDVSDEEFLKIEKSFDSHNPLRFYMNEIGEIPLLSLEQEKEYTIIINEGLKASKKLEKLEETYGFDGIDKAEYDKLNALIEKGNLYADKVINSNLRLVVSVAKRYAGFQNMQFTDLIQEGNMGLIKSIEKFEPNKGFKFSTYATWWIKQAITRAIADQSRTIRVPVHVVESINRVKKASRELTSDLGREPNDKEIADFLGMSVHKVQRLKLFDENPISLSSYVGEERDSTLEDFIPDKGKTPFDYTKDKSLHDEINNVMNQVLSEKERQVVSLRFGLNGNKTHTLEEVGKVFNVTRERIRQIEANSLRKIRISKLGKQLKTYLSAD